MRIHHQPTLFTQRLILRNFTEHDVGSLFMLLSDEEVNVFLPWFPVKNIEEAQQFLNKRLLVASVPGGAYRYAICLKEDAIPIGYICLSHEDSHDFGYALMKKHWHKGIVYEASRAVIEHIRHAGYSYITATHDIRNPRSGAVMKKLGMSYKYTYVEQWQPKNIPVTFRMYQLNFDGQERTFMKYWDLYDQHFIEDI